MKNNRQCKSKAGFTLIELIAVMVIITVIVGSVLVAVQGATNNSRIASAVSSIRSLQTAAVNYYNSNGGSYSGGTLGNISLATLASNNMLPANISGTDSWNGSITVAPDANANYVDISLAGVPTQAVASSITNAVSNLTQAAPSYTANTQTWAGAF